MTDLQKAKAFYGNGGYSVVLVKGDQRKMSLRKGILPLLEFFDEGIESGFSAADKVVGKAAAMLYVMLGVKAVYAEVLSEPARKTFDRYGIAVEYKQLVDRILNRKRDGVHSLELAVEKINAPENALDAIRSALDSQSKP